MEKPFAPISKARSRSTTRCTKVFAEEQISASTTSSAGAGPEHPLPAWQRPVRADRSRNFIDHVQIDVPETSISATGSVSTSRLALPDMAVTHLFQILGFRAMSHRLRRAQLISEEKQGFPLADAHRPRQCRARSVHTRKQPGRSESDTETFIAPRAIDNWRWAGAVLSRTAQGRKASIIHRFPRAAEEHVPRRFRR